jgi:THO complex subunit 5
MSLLLHSPPHNMVLPSTVSDPSPLDPLLLFPLPTKLPASPTTDLAPLVAALEAHLANSPADSDTNSHVSTTLLAAQMRQITRRAHILLNAARVGAAEARAKLDSIDVDLRGVEYERDRVAEEIEKCEAYE